MAEVADVLEGVEVEDSAEEATRRRVLVSYSKFQSSDRAQDLCKTFYRGLFEAMPEVQPLFSRTNMERQYDALNQAIKLLLDYDADGESAAAAVRAVALRHAQFGLGSKHLEAFEAALLGALRASGESDEETQEAWHKVLTPGLAHMSAALVSASIPDRRPALVTSPGSQTPRVDAS
jgi:hemoglobin-like flavoprotein